MIIGSRLVLKTSGPKGLESSSLSASVKYIKGENMIIERLDSQGKLYSVKYNPKSGSRHDLSTSLLIALFLSGIIRILFIIFIGI